MSSADPGPPRAATAAVGEPPAGEVPALRVAGLRKAFGGRVVLDGVDLDVPERSITALLGPSGEGKTTLLRIVAGFEHPDAGTIELRGSLVASPTVSVPPERRRVGVVPQEGALFPHLSVGDNVAFGLGRGRSAAARVRECLDLVGLAGYERARPHELSGGQQQRVALARALAPRPALVVLDEPFSSLDASLRTQVRDEVCAALRAAGSTALLVTHDQQEALSAADRVAVLLGGRVAQEADPPTLYRAPADLAVATFVGEAVVLAGHADGTTAGCALGRLDLRVPLAGEVVLVVRPEQVVVSSTDAAVPARVLDATFLGHDGLVRLVLDSGVSVTARLHAADLPRPGDRVGVRVAGPVVAFPA